MKTSCETHSAWSLAASGPLRVYEEELMGTDHKLIRTRNAVMSVLFMPTANEGKTCETIHFLFLEQNVNEGNIYSQREQSLYRCHVISS